MGKMDEYKVTIVLCVLADTEAEAYTKACQEIKAEQLSREVCTIEKE